MNPVATPNPMPGKMSLVRTPQSQAPTFSPHTGIAPHPQMMHLLSPTSGRTLGAPGDGKPFARMSVRGRIGKPKAGGY